LDKINPFILILVIGLAVPGWVLPVTHHESGIVLAKFCVNPPTCSNNAPSYIQTRQYNITFDKPFSKIPTIDIWFADLASPVAIEIPLTILATDPAAVWTNMPAAETELFGNSNHEAETNLFFLWNRVYMVVDVVNPGAVGSKLVGEWSESNTGFFAGLCDETNTLKIPSVSITTVGINVGASCQLRAVTA
jgi:hypothetical protein